MKFIKRLLLSSFLTCLVFLLFTNNGNTQNITEEVVKGCEAFENLSKSGKAVLLIHGLGGCPHETRSLGEYLNKKGFAVSGIRYPGHGTKGTVMSNYEWKDWYKTVEDKYLELKNKYDNVYVLGFSTGGTLALKLAENYDIDKVIVLSPFISVTYKWYYIFTPETYLKTVGNLIDNYPASLTLTHINDPVERKKYVRGETFSFKCARSALELIQLVKNDIKKVKSPILIMHSKADMTTDYSGSEFIYNNISSKEKKFITLYKSNHIMTLDYEKRKVFREVEGFLKDE
ncbi:MAG: alpha/beta fold hydrolase [Candidatus Sericytochromatia bacterium]